MGIILVVIIVFFGVRIASNDIPPSRDKPVSPGPINVAPAYEIRIGLIQNLMDQNDDYKEIVEIFQQDFREYLSSMDLDEVFTVKRIYVELYRDTSDFREKLDAFKAMGMNLIIGGDDEELVIEMLPHIQKNKMILLSPAVTINRSLMPSSNFFSLIYNEPDQKEKIAQAILDDGYIAAVILQTEMNTKSWNREISDSFVEHGGVIIARKTSSASLVEIETLVQDAMTSFSPKELVIIRVGSLDLTHDLRGYPTLANLTWITFGEPESYHASWWDEYGEGFSIKWVRPIPGSTSKWEDVNERFYSRTRRYLNAELSNVYDGCWVFALSFLETNSYIADQNMEWIPRVALGYEGLTGNATFNSEGDRANIQYEVVDFANKNGRIGQP